jgi:hypothetical protein
MCCWVFSEELRNITGSGRLNGVKACVVGLYGMPHDGYAKNRASGIYSEVDIKAVWGKWVRHASPYKNRWGS